MFCERLHLWKPGDGNQRLELVIHDYLEVLGEILRYLRWREHLNLAFRPTIHSSSHSARDDQAVLLTQLILMLVVDV